MIETIQDRTALWITNEPGRLQLDFSFVQKGRGRETMMFSFDLGKLYEVIQLVDEDGFRWTTSDMGKTWTRAAKVEDVVGGLGGA